ncbi:hypothetical protein CK203_015638 [Vitis vinifera]|uniref:Uncharacterized protein n=1 Tax=Vitis vinifera TaxID=29760 RepID=A0A438J5C7_VITVI|nr:hypothetical protein CK203_015638 [Vitis vinifera]
MISAKYGEEEVEWCFREMKEGTGVGFWKSIRKEWGLEVGSVERFLSRLKELRVHKDEEDRVLWIETKNRKFTVKLLHATLEPRISTSFPWSIIWKT